MVEVEIGLGDHLRDVELCRVEVLDGFEQFGREEIFVGLGVLVVREELELARARAGVAARSSRVATSARKGEFGATRLSVALTRPPGKT